MFDKERTSAQPPAAQGTSSSLADDVLVHVMPQALYGKEAIPSAVPPVLTPVPPPQRVPVPAPVVRPAIPKITPPPPRSKLPIILLLLFLLVLVAAGGVGLYVVYFAPQPVVIEPVPIPEPIIPQPEPEPPVVLPPQLPEPGKDTDSDGLTDVEELMYGTDYRDPDTDKDTYLDGNEVFHRYHPNALAPKTLLDTGAVRVLQNTELPFTVYYPSSWTPVIVASASSVTFRSPGTSAFKAAWQEKAADLSLENWYDDSVKIGDSHDLASTYTKEGLYELTSVDGRTVYLDGGNRVYIFTYDLGDETAIEYLQTFAMMVNSLILLP